MSLTFTHHVNSFIRNLMESHGLTQYEATLLLIIYSAKYLEVILDKLKGEQDGKK